VTSGIEFRDVVPFFSKHSGIVLLKHGFEDAKSAPISGFEFVSSAEIENFGSQDIYGWGDLPASHGIIWDWRSWT
jgi:hypothetical protein